MLLLAEDGMSTLEQLQSCTNAPMAWKACGADLEKRQKRNLVPQKSFLVHTEVPLRLIVVIAVPLKAGFSQLGQIVPCGGQQERVEPKG